MKALTLHRWDVTPAEARRIQLELRERMERNDRLPPIRLVAGADVALDVRGPGTPSRRAARSMARSSERPSLKSPGRPFFGTSGRAIAGVIVYRFPEMVEVERATAERPLTFPYVPGLLSFREAPALLAAFEKLRHEPDLIFYDGHGYAHPRRFGIACHLGVLLERPTIGCAKSRLIGAHAEPPRKAGGWTPLIDALEGWGAAGEMIGAVLRTRDAVAPIYVSQGHRISLERAIELVSEVCDGLRIPRPTREADHFVEAVKRGDWPPRRRPGRDCPEVASAAGAPRKRAPGKNSPKYP